MKKKIVALATFLILLVSSFSAYAINFNAETLYDSVVVVYTNSGVGSGFAIRENIIITNEHVVENHRTVTVTMYNGESVHGTVIKTDAGKDLALISIEKTMTPLEISTDKLKVGQEVYAIGAPKDIAYTMTKGIISALERKIGNNSYVQVDASINSGNSGGPLVDENGEVIGVIAMKMSDAEGIGFAINTDDIEEFTNGAEELLKSRTESENKENNTAGDEYKTGGEDEITALVEENNKLRIAVYVSVGINIILALFYILSGKSIKKEKDEFDFEIEIEE